MASLSGVKFLIQQAVKEWREDKAPQLAAALAYYTIFSIPPLLIIVLAIAGRVFRDAQARIGAEITNLLGETGGQAVIAILDNAGQPVAGGLATFVSVVTLLIGASGVFGQLQDMMNAIWEAPPRPGRGFLGAIRNRFFSFTMVLGVGFLLLVSLVISAILSAVTEVVIGDAANLAALGQIANQVVSLGMTALLFALIYKVLPDVQIAWRDVWVGAAVTALLFTIGKWAVGAYLGRSAPASAYGAAGSLIVVLFWVYYSAQILFLGAEFTQVYANKFGSRIVADHAAGSLGEPGSGSESG